MNPDKIRHAARLYVQSDLGSGEASHVAADIAHYLQHVMRMKPGDPLRLFNGRDGEWSAHIGTISKGAMEIVVDKVLRVQTASPDIWLCAAPIKKAHFDYMIEKTTELGTAVFQPVLTERTQIREVNPERCASISIEAAEQSERLDIPEIREAIALKELIADWPKDRTLIVCAEWGEAEPIRLAFATGQLSSEASKGATSDGLDAPAALTKAAILVGPEGGFSAVELAALRKVEGVRFVRLGPRILRADTAAIAALTLWQAMCGDWNPV
ncbi:MAG: 16S rRNA (uracil(1498)-N(3))-methyltransferase [Pseudomonadota bacterium]|nr:16S rRNA (uracil(1498)-N(3))-methyltransferase [Pseudomonadota bacterium]